MDKRVGFRLIISPLLALPLYTITSSILITVNFADVVPQVVFILYILKFPPLVRILNQTSFWFEDRPTLPVTYPIFLVPPSFTIIDKFEPLIILPSPRVEVAFITTVPGLHLDLKSIEACPLITVTIVLPEVTN
jgi:hypothetical protein